MVNIKIVFWKGQTTHPSYKDTQKSFGHIKFIHNGALYCMSLHNFYLID